MDCPSCSHTNPEASIFCLGCGARLSLVCSACGQELPAGSRFCNFCGTPVAEPATRSSAAPGIGPTPSNALAATHPTSFAAGRYQVKKFLGEGGKNKLYLAHDTRLDSINLADRAAID